MRRLCTVDDTGEFIPIFFPKEIGQKKLDELLAEGKAFPVMSGTCQSVLANAAGEKGGKGGGENKSDDAIGAYDADTRAAILKLPREYTAANHLAACQIMASRFIDLKLWVNPMPDDSKVSDLPTTEVVKLGLSRGVNQPIAEFGSGSFFQHDGTDDHLICTAGQLLFVLSITVRP